jgi:5-methylcytosine-specific restriction endonuclease McrA
MEARTLLLDQSYTPIQVIPWQRALTLFFQNKVEVVSEYDGFARSPTVIIKIPAVVRLIGAFRRQRKAVKFSRINIYARDDFRCQFCATKLPAAELTYDHVVPRAQGGKTTWTNIVTACEPCNRRKGNKTPAQAGMKLRKEPRQPKALSALALNINPKSSPEEWRSFLYWNAELDQD